MEILGYAGTWQVPGYYFGISAVAQDIPLAPLGGPYNSVFGPASSGQIQGLNLIFPSIPEPSYFAMLAVIVAAWIVLRSLQSQPNSIVPSS